MNAIRTATVASLFAMAATAHAPLRAEAQDVRYETATKVEFAGAMGTAMRVAAAFGGGATETVETTYIKDRRMRTDSDGSSTIMDLDSGRFTYLDHNERTYSTFTLDDFVRQTREAAEAAGAQGNAAGDQAPEAQVDIRFSVDRTNERQRVSGYDAQRVFLTMEAETEVVPEGQSEMQQAGTMVVLTDMWTARDVPILQARDAFEDASAEQFADAGAAVSQAFATALSSDPRMKVALEQSMEEASKIEGMAVRTVTTFVLVAPGKAFDRAMVTDPQPAGPSVAAQAGRAALGSVMGRFGRRPAEPEPAAAAEPTQATMLTMTSEVRNIDTRTVDPALFEVPEGYRLVEQ